MPNSSVTSRIFQYYVGNEPMYGNIVDTTSMAWQTKALTCYVGIQRCGPECSTALHTLTKSILFALSDGPLAVKETHEKMTMLKHLIDNDIYYIVVDPLKSYSTAEEFLAAMRIALKNPALECNLERDTLFEKDLNLGLFISRGPKRTGG